MSGQHLSRARYSTMTRNTQKPNSLVHSRAVHTTPAQATRTLGTPGLISREPKTELRLPLSIRVSVLPPHPLGPSNPPVKREGRCYPLDKEGDRENKERSHKGQQREHAGPANLTMSSFNTGGLLLRHSAMEAQIAYDIIHDQLAMNVPQKMLDQDLRSTSIAHCSLRSSGHLLGHFSSFSNNGNSCYPHLRKALYVGQPRWAKDTLDYRNYILNTLDGGRKYIFKESDDTIPAGKSRLMKLYIAHQTIKVLLYGLIAWILWSFALKLREYMSDMEYMSGVVELPPYSNDNIIRHKYSDVECTDSEFQSSKEDNSCEISSIENEEFRVV
uniref:(California timema) hypothetical protein n=1 Tax=Timema californicum TaxID=61474 RepID=A0A7R9J971_TIMCA|nr:unnamed protein product [Timema californicum]